MIEPDQEVTWKSFQKNAAKQIGSQNFLMVLNASEKKEMQSYGGWKQHRQGSR